VTTVWALGDSLTYGVSWPGDTPGGWRALVGDALPDLEWLGSSSDNAAPDSAAVRHDGHPGWRVDQLTALAAAGPRADVVVVQAGSNDVIQRWAPGRAFHQTYDEFDDDQRAVFAADLLARYDALLAALSATGARVLTWTAPPMGLGGPRYGSPSIADLNAGIPAVAGRHGASVVDVHLALAPTDAVSAGGLGSDGVHPTPMGYRAIADVVAPALAALLGGPPSGRDDALAAGP
jgi:lysophospholipase L1-like esterase